LEGWSWEIGRHNTAVLVCFAEISPEKGTQKTWQQCCFHFSNIHMLLGFGPRKQVLKKPLKMSYFVYLFSLSWPWKHPKENVFESFKM